MKRVLVLAAHPDDDALGCGGALILHEKAGYETHAVYATLGEQGIPGTPPAEAGKLRRTEAAEAAKTLAYKDLRELSLPDGSLDEAIVQAKLIPIIAKLQPDIVYAPHQNDAHPDHLAVAWAARRIHDLGDFRFTLRQYEIWTPLHGPNLTIDITAVVSEKRHAITRHVSQHSRNPFCEAILALNMYRGLLRGGCLYAECYEEIKP